MTVLCIDLEGVLIPEIWQAVAAHTGIPELRRTTRDVADYDELMQMRLAVLKHNAITMADISAIITRMECLAGAHEFLRALYGQREVIIVSDTFYPFAPHFMEQLGWPTLFCNDLTITAEGSIAGYTLRQQQGKKRVVEQIRALGFGTYATGDSYNDIDMITSADRGSFFRPPQTIIDAHADIPVCTTYAELLDDILQ